MPFYIASPAKQGRNTNFNIWTTGFATRQQAAAAAAELQGTDPYVLIEAHDLRDAVQQLHLQPPLARRRRTGSQRHAPPGVQPTRSPRGAAGARAS
jgi:hypothetical protein